MMAVAVMGLVYEFVVSVKFIKEVELLSKFNMKFLFCINYYFDNDPESTLLYYCFNWLNLRWAFLQQQQQINVVVNNTANPTTPPIIP